MEDFYLDGYNEGRGWKWKNSGHEEPRNFLDEVSYQEGLKYGKLRKTFEDELDE